MAIGRSIPLSALPVLWPFESLASIETIEDRHAAFGWRPHSESYLQRVAGFRRNHRNGQPK
jgi:hypothetical protein